MQYLFNILFFLILISHSFVSGFEYQLSVACIFQNEAPYLKEWIEYHKKVGVDHFYLYNNESNDQFLSVLESYIQDSIVELIDWPTLHPEVTFAKGVQHDMCGEALNRARGQTEWLAIIDTDEFMVPMVGTHVITILNSAPANVGAFYLNWRQFGTGGITCDPSSILNHLKRCAPKDHLWCSYGKTIVRPSAAESARTPHWCNLKEGFLYWSGDGEPYPFMKLYSTDSIHHDRLLRINHYTFRDEYFFTNEKIPRCQKWNRPGIDDVRTLLSLNEQFSQQTDEKIIQLMAE